MIKLSTRPYSYAEKEKHLREIPSSRVLFERGLMLYILILALCVSPIVLIDKWININSDLMLFLVFGVIVLAWLILVKFYKPFEKAKKYHQMEDQVAQGYVHIMHVNPSKAFRIEGARGFPIGYYLEVEHNQNIQTLYLSGIYVNDFDDDQKFPNTQFEIYRDSISGEVIEIYLYGSYFQPERIFIKADDARTKIHKDGHLLNDSIEEIKMMFGYMSKKL